MDSFGEVLLPFQSFPGGASGKEPACQCRRHKRLRFKFWVWKIPWRRAWQPTPVSLPGESHGWRSLASYSPWGREGSETTERLSIHTYFCHEVPQAGWLKTVKIHCLMFWRLEAQNQSVRRASLPLKETFWPVPRSGDTSVP